MKKTITKKIMGLAIGVTSLTASAQCPTITSVSAFAGANGTISYSTSISANAAGVYVSAISGTNQAYGNGTVGGSITVAANGIYNVCVRATNDTVANPSCPYMSPQICTTVSVTTVVTPTVTPSNCATINSFSAIASSTPGEYNINAQVTGTYAANTVFSAYAYGPGIVTSNTGFGANTSGSLSFSQNGNYNVCVYLNDSTQNCWDMYCQNITVNNVTAANTPTCVADASFALLQDSTVAGTYLGYNYGTGTGTVSYLWNFGDGTTSTQAYPTHIYASAGFYTICLTVTATDVTGNSTCTDTECTAGGYKLAATGQLGKLVIKNPGVTTGINEQMNLVASLNAFPNPMNDELTIEVALTNNSTALVYTVVDALGKVVAQNKLDGSKAIINTAQLEKGFYFLSVSTEKGQVLKSTKLVK